MRVWHKRERSTSYLRVSKAAAGFHVTNILFYFKLMKTHRVFPRRGREWCAALAGELRNREQLPATSTRWHSSLTVMFWELRIFLTEMTLFVALD